LRLCIDKKAVDPNRLRERDLPVWLFAFFNLSRGFAKSCRNALLGIFIFSFSFGALVPAFAPASLGYAQGVEEYDLKAVYLYNFLHFVEWPPEVARSRGKSMVIGVLGESAILDSLEKLKLSLTEKQAKLITIKNFGAYEDNQDLTVCHLLFIDASEEKNMSRILGVLEGAPVLTVADTEDFPDEGGMIALVPRRDKVRWIINRTPAERAGLRLSSQLLKIAVSVKDSSGRR